MRLNCILRDLFRDTLLNHLACPNTVFDVFGHIWLYLAVFGHVFDLAKYGQVSLKSFVFSHLFSSYFSTLKAKKHFQHIKINILISGVKIAV